MKKYLPVMLDVTNKKILILGAGKAGAEKLRTLGGLGIKVTVISETFLEEFQDKPWLDLIQKSYEYGDLNGFDIVYCGINNPNLESLVLQEAKEKSILINFIDKVEDSQFISASSIIKEAFTIFISTYGKAPGGAKKLREEIESKLDLEHLNREINILAEERARKKLHAS
jgi:precorrin-2 dehydrogenase / sirohydrochlorin ferrochelatase